MLAVIDLFFSTCGLVDERGDDGRTGDQRTADGTLAAW